MAVRSRSKPSPVDVTPIPEIVPRFVAWARPIADFIPFEARLRRTGHRRSRICSPRRHRPEWATCPQRFVDPSSYSARWSVHMRKYGSRPNQWRCARKYANRQALPRRSVDQIHAGTHAGRCSAAPTPAATLAGVCVRSSVFQHIRHRRLHAEGNTVEPAIRQFASHSRLSPCRDSLRW